MPKLEKMAGGNLWKDAKGAYIDLPKIAVLVNGQYKPKLAIKSGQWYRLRMIFSAVELGIQAYPLFGVDVQCEMKLLAKDGIYLHETPRAIDKVHLASGNRADVALRCKCIGKQSCSTHLVSAATKPGQDKDKDLLESIADAVLGADKVIVQYLLRLDIEDGTPAPALPLFKVKRPCYLADLRSVAVPKSNQGRIELMNPGDWKLQYAPSLFGGSATGQSMLMMNEKPMATINVGEVYEWYLRGPQNTIFKDNNQEGLSNHPFHLHVIPYQIASIESEDAYFQPGDWHDTLLHPSGQAMVKLQTDRFTGHMIMHCHILDHEDLGMMSHMMVNGREGAVWEGATKVDPTCYRKLSGVGFTVLPSPSVSVPRWVMSEPNSNCHAACADFGGCAVGAASQAELNVALQQMSVKCTSIKASSKKYAPSMRQGGACIRGFSGKGHCGVIAPKGVSRFCRCHGGVPK
jgi:hypothetical protein